MLMFLCQMIEKANKRQSKRGRLTSFLEQRANTDGSSKLVAGEALVDALV